MKREQYEQSSNVEEEQIKFKERLSNARKMFTDFVGLKEKEKVLFMLDEGFKTTDSELIDILKKYLNQSGNEFNEIIVDKKTSREALFNIVEKHDVIWNSTLRDNPRTHFKELTKILEKTGKRMVHSPGIKAECLDNEGALSEDKEALDERLDKMEAKLWEAAGFHITSVYGTDLWVKLRSGGERRWFKDNGTIKPGGWDNLPGGEIMTTPDEENVNGILILPVLCDEVASDQGVDQFARLTIRSGKIAKIDGGESAEKLRKYLEEKSEEEKNPLSVLQCAEIAFGANSKARSVVSDPDGSYKDIGYPVAETEKRLGTTHLGFGSSKHGEEGIEGHTESKVHIDFVIPRHGLTVRKFDSDENFKKRKNGRRLIDEGRWRFIE